MIEVEYDLIVATDGWGGFILHINPEIAEWKEGWIDNEGSDMLDGLELATGLYEIEMVWNGDHDSGCLDFEVVKTIWKRG